MVMYVHIKAQGGGAQRLNPGHYIGQHGLAYAPALQAGQQVYFVQLKDVRRHLRKGGECNRLPLVVPNEEPVPLRHLLRQRFRRVELLQHIGYLIWACRFAATPAWPACG